MNCYLLVACGGAFGSLLRFCISGAVTARAGQAAWGTLTVNVLGCLLIGVIAASRKDAFSNYFLMVGVMGGFTTFSAFSLQTLDFMSRGEMGWALGNVLVSVTVCLLAVWLGTWLGR